MMASINQVCTALSIYYDEEIRPTLPDIKGKLFGVAVGVALAKPEKAIQFARSMGVIDDKGNVDTDLLAKEIKKNLFSGDGTFEIKKNLNPFNPADIDVFRFKASDIDKLLDIINRL